MLAYLLFFYNGLLKGLRCRLEEPLPPRQHLLTVGLGKQLEPRLKAKGSFYVLCLYMKFQALLIIIMMMPSFGKENALKECGQ